MEEQSVEEIKENGFYQRNDRHNILIHHAEGLPLLASSSSQEILVPQQDQSSAQSELLMPPELSTSTTKQYSASETPIHQVKPVLGTTPAENWQLQDRN